MASNLPISGLPAVPLGTLPANCLLLLSIEISPGVWQSYSATPAQLAILLGGSSGGGGGGSSGAVADLSEPGNFTQTVL